jgi:hypothetical protein
VPALVHSFLEVRGIGQLFVHSALSERARSRLSSRVGCPTGPLTDAFDDRELHPLFLATSWPHAPMAEPSFPGARLGRIKLACWGAIGEKERPHYEQRFMMRSVQILGSHHRAMLEEQCRGRTPLALSSRYMGVFFAEGWISPLPVGLRSRELQRACRVLERAGASTRLGRRAEHDRHW